MDANDLKGRREPRERAPRPPAAARRLGESVTDLVFVDSIHPRPRPRKKRKG